MSVIPALPSAGGLPERLRLLLLGRVLTVSVFLAGAGTVYLGGGASGVVFGSPTFWGVAAAYAGTLASALWLQRRPPSPAVARLQIVFDVALVTGAIGLLGDVSAPFVLLYTLPVASGAGLLQRRGALLAAGASATAYGGLAVATAQGSTGVAWAAVAVGAVGLAGLGWLIGAFAERLGRMEEELADRRGEMDRLAKLHRVLADGLECGVLITDASDSVRSVNPAAQQILGQSSTDLTGREIGWLLPLLETAMESGCAADGHVECDYRAGEGQTKRLRVKSEAFSDTWGRPSGRMVLLQDVTRLQELEERLSAEDASALVLPEGPEAEGDDGADAPFGLVGSCPQMRAVRKMVEKVADTDATVLIQGESGTGKELVARAVHDGSTRAGGPFVVVNCGAIPENLIESELFGHVRGAFTGADRDRPGLFRRADGGTVFLDEIGELPLGLQVRLLRVLQDRTVMPVGGSKPISVDVRVVAATNRDLEKLVREGAYREDLYYRLAVIAVETPPLRDRGEDLSRLISHFLERASQRHGKSVEGISGRAMKRLLAHPYPGNVRELENVIEHATTLAEGETIREADLPDAVRDPRDVAAAARQLASSDVAVAESAIEEPPVVEAPLDEEPIAAEPHAVLLPVDEGEGLSLDDQLARQEKEMLLAALARAAGVKKKAATLLGINYRSFRHRLQKYGLDAQASGAMSRLAGTALPRETSH